MSFCKTCGHGLNPETKSSPSRKERRERSKKKANKLATKALEKLNIDGSKEDH